jgi:hypothetical protein
MLHPDGGEQIRKCIGKQAWIPPVLAVFCIMFVLVSCGKKGPPVPLWAPELPAVTDLSYTMTGDVVTLIWKAPVGPAAKDLSGFTVLRSMASLDEKDCPGCPVIFERVAKLGPHTTRFSEPLASGKRYIYKVVGFTSYNSISADSELIRFDYGSR